MITFIIVTILIITILGSWLSLIQGTKRYNVAGPFPLPLVGNGLKFVTKRSDFLPLLRRLKDSYGDAFRCYLFHSAYMVISHPKYIEPLIFNSDYMVKGRSYSFLHPWLGDGLLTSSGHRWKTFRKFLTPAFHFNILQNYLQVFLKNEKILLKKLSKHSDGKPLDLFPIIALMALDNVTESIMGVSIDAQLNLESDYVKSIDAISEILSMRIRNPFMGANFFFNLSPYKKIHDEALKVLHGQTNQVINFRRKEIKDSKIKLEVEDETQIGIKNKFAFLDLLLMSEVDGKNIDDDKIREEVDTFMFEGHDTTTSGIVFALYCISNHLEVQQKILDEQKSIFGNDLNKDPQYADLQQMKYLEMVIKESLRLYPSVPLIERLITKDCKIGSMDIPANTSIIVNIFELHRHPELYEDPLEFRPERFSSTEIVNSKNAINWLAFSAGLRNCIGQKFAMMEMKVIIAGIIKKYNLLPVHEVPILCADLILRSENGVKIKLSNRE